MSTSRLYMSQWGPAGWHTLHVTAHSAPRVLSPEQRRDMQQFLRLFAAHLPCPRCRRHFADFLERRLCDEAVATRAALVILLNDAHNEVNARLGKRVFTLEEHYREFAATATAPPREWLAWVAAGGGALMVAALLTARQRRRRGTPTA